MNKKNYKYYVTTFGRESSILKFETKKEQSDWLKENKKYKISKVVSKGKIVNGKGVPFKSRSKKK